MNSQGRLEGKVALITGAASGIGAAAARRFLAEGASVLLCDIQQEKLKHLAGELGKAALWKRLDVCSAEDWEKAVSAAGEFGPLTTVINCAGVSIPGTIEDLDLAGWRQTTSINLDGVFLGTKYGVDALKHGKGGAIVNVASTLAWRSGALFPAYSASKAGVRLLTQSAALHCAEQGYDIRVNTISPGAIHTEMVEGYVAAGERAGQTREDVLSGFANAHPMKRLGKPGEPADAIVFLASDEASYTTGADIPVDGGFLA